MDHSELLQTAALSREGACPSAYTSSNEPSRGILDMISKQLKDLDREEEELIRSIARKRLELKRLWNSALPIHKLPNELLAQLFVDCRGAIELQFWSNSGRVEPFRKGWQGLMLVCRHWRDILVSTPLFWRRVDLRQEINWAKLCLARSSPAPIEVFARHQVHRCPLEVIYPHACRFQTFFFETAYGPQLQGALSCLFAGGMPLLEELDFIILERPPPADAVDPGLTLQRYPCLQVLKLSGSAVVAPRDVSLYAQLRMLRLSSCSHPLSFDEFLDALTACAQLEQLILINTLHSLSGEWAHARVPVLRRPPISLVRLREFSLIAHGARRTSRFLAHFYLQPSVVLYIGAYFHWTLAAGEAPDTNTAQNVGAMLPPNRLATLPVLATTTHLEMLVMYDGYDIRCSHAKANLIDPTGSPSRASLSRFAVSKDEHTWDASLMEGLNDLVECFGRAPLTSLKVDVVILQAHATADAWERVFQTFPRLEALDVCREIDVATVFLGLHGASTLGINHADCRVACPNLAHVHVGGCGLGAAYAAMLECFQCRADKGVRLDVLDLEDMYDEEDLTLDARCVFIEDLRLVVDCVRVKGN